MGALDMDATERFMRHVSMRSERGCWLWRGAAGANGYGVVPGRGLAHRVSWELHRGPIPDGQVVRHLVCDRRLCVNPEHLALGTMAENMADMRSAGRARNPRQSRREMDILITSERWRHKSAMFSALHLVAGPAVRLPEAMAEAVAAQCGGPSQPTEANFASFLAVTGYEVIEALGPQWVGMLEKARERGIGLGDLVAELALKAPE